ncbi:hypothetical protein SAMN05878482_103485 [Peribacillus simplex]|uniref:Uncharacterized protein n=1 Tax=Peribacillus simplex TaxID=1478 RepID=A0A9X8R9N2_9BACI|nr:hypothetical protein [Peribacillus simplex]SIR38157.1 hypothetical protein SAMN05878482_103485 [Peribacillus simplex]
MTKPLDKILEGLTVSEIIKPTTEPTPLNEERMRLYFDAVNKPYIFYNPYSSIQRNAKLKDTDTGQQSKQNNPTS